MTPDQRVTRRELFEATIDRLAKTAILAPIFAACAPAAVSSSDSAESKAALTTAEQQIKMAGINYWKKMLAQNQRVDEGSQQFDRRILEFKSSFNSDVWNDNLFTQLARGGKVDSPLRMNWVGLLTKNDPNNGWAGWRWTGEVEFTDIVLTLTPPGKSASDWAGGVNFRFKERGRSLYERSTRWIKTEGEFQKWLSSSAPSLPDFSQPREGVFGFIMLVKNGQTQIDLPLHPGAGPDLDGLVARRFPLPSAFISDGGCDPKNNCRTVNVN